jgi:hypothetical protein
MSDIKIQPSATGSGTVTITAPTTNTARVITLPDSAGTLLDENSSVPAANLTGTVADARFPATLPAASGVNLTAIPAANLTGTVADARISALTASKLTGALPAISAASLTGLTSSQMPAGSVLQVVSAERRTHLSLTADNTADWITLTITPTSTSSKIKLSVMGGTSSDNGNNFSMLLLHRDTTNIAYGNSVGSSTPCWIDIGCRAASQGDTYIYQQKPFSGVYIDSPNTTSAITYKAKVRNKVNGTLYLGRTSNTADSNRTTTMGMLIAEEIGA